MTLITDEDDGPDRSGPVDPGLLLEEPISVPAAFKEEPSGPELFVRIATLGLTSLEIGDEADALIIKEAKRLAAITTPIEYQSERCWAMGSTNLLYSCGDRAS